MEYKQEIKIEEGEILSPLQLLLAIEKINWQLARLISDADSEEGTFQREVKRIKEDITKFELEYRNTMYDQEKGIIVKLDRLSIESKERKVIKNQIFALWIALGSVVLGFILKWIIIK